MTRVILIVLLLIFRIVSSGDNQCKFGASVNITNSILEHATKNRLFNNVTYTPANYYSDNNMVHGCLCQVKTCMRKCCPSGQILFEKICTVNDTYPDIRKAAMEGNDDRFELFYGTVYCPFPRNRYLLENYEFAMQSDGTLRYDSLLIPQEDYCVDYFFSEIPNAMVCTDPGDETSETILSRVSD